jgi:hypothetical protein
LPILLTLIVEAISSSETSVLTRNTWRNIAGDGILLSKFSGVCHSFLFIWYPQYQLRFCMNGLFLVCGFNRQNCCSYIWWCECVQCMLPLQFASYC